MKENVLLIVLDAVRADHTSVNGYDRQTTPNLKELSLDGYLFEQAFAAAPWTPPSHGSIFSGVYPSTHGYFDGWMPYHPPHLSIAERLRQEGYHTFGAVRNGHIDSRKEVTRGFEAYADIYRYPRIPSSWKQVKAEYIDLLNGFGNLAYSVTRQVIDPRTEYLRRPSEYVTCEYIRQQILNVTGPFFGFININSAHTPYGPPDPWLSRFESFDRDDVDMQVVKSLAHVDGKGGKRFLAGELEPSKEEWQAVQDWYDGEISFADSLVGRLIETLHSKNIYDETLIVVTADHGEHFGEHRRAAHQFSLFDELLHVPLIVKPPENERDRISHTAGLRSLVDIYPTILGELGLSIPGSVDGKDLFKSKPNDVIFAEYGDPKTAISSLKRAIDETVEEEILSSLNHPLQCVRSEDKKYVHVHGGTDRVYKLEDGTPKESLLRYGRDETLHERLRETLRDDLSVWKPESVDSKTRENLKELGYI